MDSGNDRIRQDFVDKIKPLLIRSDVLNFDSHAPWWKLHFRVGYWGIRRHHKRLFGKMGRWRDTHSMLYLAEDACFSLEPPRCRWWTLADLYDTRMTVWRYTKRTFTERELEEMCIAANSLIGKKYDIGQLVDFMINEAMGYDNVMHYKIFDAGRHRKVCSVGVRVAYEATRKFNNEVGDGGMDRLFSKFKDPAWAQRPGVPGMNKQRRGVDVEATAPGHFANSHFYDDEFELIAEFDNGRQLYPKDNKSAITTATPPQT